MQESNKSHISNYKLQMKTWVRSLKLPNIYNVPSTPHTLNTGFTLIELLVVMIILAALVFIASSSFVSAQMKARDAERKSDLKQISNALELYYADYGEYPASDSEYRIVGCGTAGSEEPCNAGNQFALSTGSGTTVYMVQIPTDPRSGNYLYMSSGNSYQLYARLENHKDQQVRNPDDDDPDTDQSKDVYVGGCKGNLGCNFGIASSNITIDTPID